MNTITPLQTAWPKRAHLHKWTNANGQGIVRGISSTFGQLSQSQTKYYTGSVLLYGQPGGLACPRQEGHASRTQIKAHRGWGKGWRAGQYFYRLSNHHWHVLYNYHPYDLRISLIKCLMMCNKQVYFPFLLQSNVFSYKLMTLNIKSHLFIQTVATVFLLLFCRFNFRLDVYLCYDVCIFSICSNTFRHKMSFGIKEVLTYLLVYPYFSEFLLHYTSSLGCFHP